MDNSKIHVELKKKFEEWYHGPDGSHKDRIKILDKYSDITSAYPIHVYVVELSVANGERKEVQIARLFMIGDTAEISIDHKFTRSYFDEKIHASPTCCGNDGECGNCV